MVKTELCIMPSLTSSCVTTLVLQVLLATPAEVNLSKTPTGAC